MSDAPRIYLEQWRNAFRLHQECHYEAAKRLRRRARLLGVAVVALSALVGASVLRSIADSVGSDAKVALGLMSVLSGALAAVQTFLDLPSQAEQHRQAAVEYGDLRREMDRVLAASEPELSDDRAARIQTRWHEVDSIAPEIPSSILAGGPKRLRTRRDEMQQLRST
jgi:hypothetical protein